MLRGSKTGRRRDTMIAAVLAVALLAPFSARLGRLDHNTQDLRFRLRGERPPSGEVALVTLDEQTLLAQGPWPWPLERVAELVDRLAAARPAVIALDLEALLPATLAPGVSTPGVAALRESLARAGNVVLPAVKQPATLGQDRPLAGALLRFAAGTGELAQPRALARGPLLAPADALVEAAAGVGTLNVAAETDHVLRKLPLLVSAQGRLFPSFTAEVVRVYRGAPVGAVTLEARQGRVDLAGQLLPVDPAAEFLVNYTGGSEAFPRVLAATVLAQGAPQDWAGKIVIVGLTAGSGAQAFPTPLGTRLPGPEVQANGVECLLTGDVLRTLPLWAAWGIALLCGLLLAWWLPGLPAPTALLATAGAVVGYYGLSAAVFLTNLVLPTSAPTLTLVVTGVFAAVMAARAAERAQTQAQARAETRVRTLGNVGHLLASGLDRARLLHEILVWVQRELEVEAVSLLVMTPERKLRFEATLGGAPEQIKDFTLELGQGIAGTVALTGEPLIVNNAPADPRQARDIAQAVGFAPRSLLCVPMVRHERVVGVIEALNRREGRPFAAPDADLLTVIAQQAAVFLENAQLYAELQERVDFANAELRQANQELASQKARVETVLREMSAGMVATDEADRILLVNETAQRMLEVRQGQIQGRPVAEVVACAPLREMFAQPLRSPAEACVREIELPPGSGRVVRAVLSRLDLADEVIGKCLLLTDITQFVELDRMKTDLISFVSHELKNPLAALQGFVRLMRGAAPASAEPLATYLACAERQARRMQYLVEDYLDMSRLDAGRPPELQREPLADLRRLVEEVVTLEIGPDPGREVRVKVAEGLPVIHADRRKLQQVLVNLVGNALKYTAPPGAITVTVASQEGQVEFAVADEGPGVGAEQHKHLFQRFRRLREPGAGPVPGTGIGLYLCKHLVEAHGGRIWLESEAGQGAVFKFTLPAGPPPEA